MRMVESKPSGHWEGHVQRPCGRKLSICKGLHAERCVGGGGTSGLVTRARPDQAGVLEQCQERGLKSKSNGNSLNRVRGDGSRRSDLHPEKLSLAASESHAVGGNRKQAGGSWQGGRQT